MLTFETADESSLDAFLSVSARSRYQEQLREYAEALLIARRRSFQHTFAA